MDEESPESPGPAAYKMDDNAEAKIYTRYGKNCACLALNLTLCLRCSPLLTGMCVSAGLQTWDTKIARAQSTIANSGRKRMRTGTAYSQPRVRAVGHQSDWLIRRRAQTCRRSRFREPSDLTIDCAGTPPGFALPQRNREVVLALC